MQGVSLVYRV